MRILVFLALFGFCLVSTSALAVNGLGPLGVTNDRAARLDSLFARLATAAHAGEAMEIERRIWEVWANPDDPILASLMGEAFQKRRNYDFAGAVEVLNRVVAGWPDYAEGWNQRATVYYMMDRFDDSLADIAETLLREPRHFGALAGRAMIRAQQGKRALAIQTMKEVLKIHPFLRERALFPELGH